MVLEASAVVDVDYSGGETLKQVVNELHDRGASLVIAQLSESVRPELDKPGITEAIGADAFYETVAEAVEAPQTTGTASAGPGPAPAP